MQGTAFHPLPVCTPRTVQVTACELYNSIAQLMITKHRKWDEQHKTKLKKQGMHMINSRVGDALVVVTEPSLLFRRLWRVQRMNGYWCRKKAVST
jgi:hypothetical protein